MASALEQYVNNVRTLSSQGNFSQLCELISKNTEQLAKNAGHLDNALGTFDMQQHSLGVLGILCVKYSLPNIPDFETLFVQTQEFINSCNGEQVRYATDSYADLCHKFTHNLVERKQAIRGISVLCKAISKIQINPSQLTSIHGDLCQLCLLSKCMKPALSFMEVDVTEISKEGGQYDAKNFLLYYYYGGMIYTALKNYERALYFFEVAITTPSMAVSHIMLEAYKKYILVALMLHGKIPNLPKYTPQVVGRYIKPLCQNYHDLATAYGTNNPTELRTVVTKHTESFTRDTNMGLVKQCVTSLYKKNIQRLTKIPNLPKYTPQVVGRYIKPLCQNYHDLATAYGTNNPTELRTVVTKHTESFTRDTNMGLVKQCVTSLYKKNIQRLTKTFLTLSLSDMANRVQLSGPREAEKYVLHMIEDGEIFATINQKDGMVSFHDNPEKYNNAAMLLQLDVEMRKCHALDEKMKDMDREITVNPQYVQKNSGVHEEDMPGSSMKVPGGYAM